MLEIVQPVLRSCAAEHFMTLFVALMISFRSVSACLGMRSKLATKSIGCAAFCRCGACIIADSTVHHCAAWYSSCTHTNVVHLAVLCSTRPWLLQNSVNLLR